ncbi:MAG: Homoserine kinase [Cytophagales bacterium]|jgi:homoserine kinase|nr:homoserine kinase [Bacteroidota bacterium]MBS1980086.1 homoserine kinase [Bacteroidota bacterium]WHZ07161.1 MAG: Homoserine kinase [Cytophagales bacterium]
MSKKIKVFAPASIGNVSCGFDVLGLAVTQPGDVVEISLNDSGQVTIQSILGDEGRLPLEAAKNTSGVAVIEFLKSIQSNQGVSITLHKNLPLGSGMGSSAASAVAAAVGINELMGSPLKKIDLLPFAMEAERVACGSAHADNAAPSLLGGLILIRENHPLDIIEIPTPKELFCVLVHPHIEVKTRDARSVLKQTISLQDGITQWANTAALVAGMMKEDYELIGRSLVDVVAEPLRADLIPSFNKVKQTALKNGALGCGISGSGPTVFCLCKGRAEAELAGQSIRDVFLNISLENEVFVSEVNRQGAYALIS